VSTGIARLLRAQQEHLVNQVMANDRIAREFGLGLTELQLVHLLVLHPSIDTARALADRTGLSSSTISDMVDRLERAGFITRERDDEDRRRLLIRLTGRREEIEARYRTSELGDRMNAALAGFTEADVTTLQTYFDRLNSRQP
jgi:DNA-binding MarR family transcriptional regulator